MTLRDEEGGKGRRGREGGKSKRTALLSSHRRSHGPHEPSTEPILELFKLFLLRLKLLLPLFLDPLDLRRRPLLQIYQFVLRKLLREQRLVPVRLDGLEAGTDELVFGVLAGDLLLEMLEVRGDFELVV